MMCEDQEPVVIIPEGFSVSREEDLKYFEEFVPEEHRPFVGLSY